MGFGLTDRAGTANAGASASHRTRVRCARTSISMSTTADAERDEGRIGQSQAVEWLINERAALNAVDGPIKLASSRELLGRKIA